jgi:hypothetical protein
MSPIMTSIAEKLSNKVPIIIFQMLLAERRTHNNRAFFNGFERVFMGSIMRSKNIMGLDYQSNISAHKLRARSCPSNQNTGHFFVQ